MTGSRVASVDTQRGYNALRTRPGMGGVDVDYVFGQRRRIGGTDRGNRNTVSWKSRGSWNGRNGLGVFSRRAGNLRR